jgi:hypothetical protein
MTVFRNIRIFIREHPLPVKTRKAKRRLPQLSAGGPRRAPRQKPHEAARIAIFYIIDKKENEFKYLLSITGDTQSVLFVGGTWRPPGSGEP